MTTKKGAQPGNTNAIKHGIYSSKFKSADFAGLEAASEGIDAELDALRVVSGTLFGYLQDLRSKKHDLDTFKDFLAASDAFDRKCKTIGTLVKTKVLVTGSTDDAIARAAIDAILQVYQEKCK